MTNPFESPGRPETPRRFISSMALKVYLKFVNPILAIAIFLLCAYAATKDPEKPIQFSNLFAGSFTTYFFAKGIFCSIAVFLCCGQNP